VTGGELFDEIVEKGHLEDKQARMYFHQLVDAVAYCHSKGVSHRDLKPENLLLDDNGDLKISDFGLSALVKGDGKQTRAELLHTTCGTPNYVAPEVLADNGYDGPAADTWSLGVILYVLLAGFLPFDEPTMSALFRKIGKAEFAYPSWFSQDVRHLIDRILIVDVSKRWSLEQIRQHPWMQAGMAGAGSAAGGGGDDESKSRRSSGFNRDGTPMPPTPSKQDMDNAIADAGLDDDVDFAEEAEVARLNVNVFDLINRVAGDSLTRLFDSTESAKNARSVPRYITLKNPAEAFEIVGSVISAQAEQVAVEEVNTTLRRYVINSSRGQIGVNVTCRQISDAPVLYLVEITKGRGQLMHYASAVAGFKDAIADALRA
jgi:hypothetical protein